MHQSKYISQSVTPKLLPTVLCPYLNGFLYRFFLMSPAACISVGDGQRYGLISWWGALHTDLYASSALPEHWSRMRIERVGQVMCCCRVGRCTERERVLKSPSTNTVCLVDCENAPLKQSHPVSFLIIRSRHIDQRNGNLSALAWYIQLEYQSLVNTCSITLHCVAQVLSTKIHSHPPIALCDVVLSPSILSCLSHVSVKQIKLLLLKSSSNVALAANSSSLLFNDHTFDRVITGSGWRLPCLRNLFLIPALEPERNIITNASRHETHKLNQ